MKRIVKQPEERKRELIAVALKLFCEKGYEQTSIRDILCEVGGEVGMFYHYFKSKEDVFDQAVDLFLDDFVAEVSRISLNDATPLKQSVVELLEVMNESILRYKEIWSEKLHWSMAGAIHIKTLGRMLPSIERLLSRAAENSEAHIMSSEEIHNSALFLLFGTSAVLHEKPFKEMTILEYRQKMQVVSDLVTRFIGGGGTLGV